MGRVIPAVPLLIRVFADRLREDQGRQLGRAVLFASIVGFDVVERRKGDIAAISGVPAARIQEIVDTGRQALNTASPMVREQHVVSRALLRRFLGRRTRVTGYFPTTSNSAEPICGRRERSASSRTS